MSERTELLWRLLVGIVSGIVLAVWKGLIFIITVVNWVIVLFSGKRNKELADFCEIWNTQTYKYLRYITMVSNERVFPFEKIGKNISVFKK